MKKLHFTYDMQIAYSTEVSKCNFTIKCIPQDTKRQTIENLKIELLPPTRYQTGFDGFKNAQIYGVNFDEHTNFRFQIEGDAVTGLASYEDEVDTNLSMVFGHPHGLNVAGETILKFYDENIEKIEKKATSTKQKATMMMHALNEAFAYQPCTTDVKTSAEEAFSQGCGVCQDYAHILIALLHLAEISARYVTGFIMGEGQSHAWVEYLDEGKWYGIDPTNNQMVNDDYIKIGHGRDANDCQINRGIMRGGGLHTQCVFVNVVEA